VRILISCKDHRHPLDIEHITAFQGQIGSTGASMGIIYSRAGFTQPALDKAKAAGLVCCRLYQNQSADIPDHLILPAYHARSRASLRFVPEGGPAEHLRTWGDLFDLPADDGTGAAATGTVLDLIQKVFHGAGRRALAGPFEGPFPKAWEEHIGIIAPWAERLAIAVCGSWRRFRSRAEAHYLAGSYCFASESFHGSQASPSIDTMNEDPGPGWEEISDAEPSQGLPPGVTLHLHQSEIASVFRKELGPKPLHWPA
jgi:hypothetical protein